MLGGWVGFSFKECRVIKDIMSLFNYSKTPYDHKWKEVAGL